MWGKSGGARTVVACVVAALFLVGVVVVWPLVDYISTSSDSSGPDPVAITDYSADLSLAEDGTLTAAETVTANFPFGRHGIFRFWDLTDPSDPHVRLVPHDIGVTLDGADVPVDLSWQNGTRYRVARIGDPDSYVSPGSHTYVISYTIDGALAPTSVGQGTFQTSSWVDGDSAGSTFYWNVVAPGWQMDIARATVVIHLPATSGDVKCAVGYYAGDPCRIAGAGTRELTVSTGSLAPRTPVTVRADVETPVPDRVTVPWPPALDGVLGRWPWLALALLLLAVVGFVAGAFLAARSRETRPGYPVTYAPADGLGPVQACYIVRESVPDEGLTATLLHQAERGLTKLEDDGNGTWTITGIGTPEAWAQADSVTQSVGQGLGLVGQGTFRADKSVAAGQKLASVKSQLAMDARDWAITAKLLVSASHETVARVLVGLALVIGGILAFWNPFHLTLLAIPFLAFALGGAGLMRTGVGTRRTPEGRQVWSRAGGFQRLLSTTSAQDRFDFSAHRELYTAYIPYAVAFACADAWARKYQAWTGEQAPIPTWYPVYAGSSGGWFGGGSSFDGFESSLRSSISAYEATQSSSSGGGGGGGGSW